MSAAKEESLCPDCQGDGYLIHTGSPGYYSSAFDNWLPNETELACVRCHGAGTTEVEKEDDDGSVLPGG